MLWIASVCLKQMSFLRKTGPTATVKRIQCQEHSKHYRWLLVSIIWIFTLTLYCSTFPFFAENCKNTFFESNARQLIRNLNLKIKKGTPDLLGSTIRIKCFKISWNRWIRLLVVIYVFDYYESLFRSIRKVITDHFIHAALIFQSNFLR